MSKKLDHVQEWQSLTQRANWSVAKMAKLCNVSVRTLERHFGETLGTTPKAWMAEYRQNQAVELWRKGTTVKEAAALLGYSYPTNLTRKLKTSGIVPVHRTAIKQISNKLSQNDAK
jgi:AraC-like DNA-binding protein